MPTAGGFSRLRLRSGADFGAVYRNRRSRGGKLLVLHWRASGLAHARVGFSISKKVGNAVERNRVKRCLRELAWPLLDPLGRGIDIVVVVRPVASAVACAELRAEFRELAGQVLGL